MPNSADPATGRTPQEPGGQDATRRSAGLLRRLFPLPPSQVPAAENWTTHGARTPRAARRASSVVLLRDGQRGVETYLGYRPGMSPLGTVAFPGGSFEADDDAPLAWHGPTAGEWAARLGILDHRIARAHVVCAVRELFEETGVLLAGPDGLSLVENTTTEEWMEVRQAVAGQDLSFAEVLARRGLGLRSDLLRPLFHLTSPDFAHRRFDTIYFAAVLPDGQRAQLLRGKGTWAAWKAAADVVAGRSGTGLGDEVGQPDTVGLDLSRITSPAVEYVLEKIATTRGTVAYLSHRREVRSYQPELVVEDGQYYLATTFSAAAEGGGTTRGR